MKFYPNQHTCKIITLMTFIFLFQIVQTYAWPFITASQTSRTCSLGGIRFLHSPPFFNLSYITEWTNSVNYDISHENVQPQRFSCSSFEDVAESCMHPVSCSQATRLGALRPLAISPALPPATLKSSELRVQSAYALAATTSLDGVQFR